MARTKIATDEPVDTKLEVVVLGVSDVDRAKAFYEKLGWRLQEIRTRLPGREGKSARARGTDVATLAGLLHETAEHHDHFEKTHAEHHWWDWYAPYLSARQNASSPEEAAAAADHYMEEVLHVLPQ